MNKALVIGIGSVVLAGSAFGQLGLNPLSVRAGYSMFPSKESRDLTSTGGYTLGAGFDVPLSFQGGRLSIDLDFDSHRGNGAKMETVGLQAIVRAPLVLQVGTPLGKVGPYYGYGIGIFRDHVSGSTTTQVAQTQSAPRATVTTSYSDTSNRVGGSFLLGFQFTKLAAVEAYYRLSGSVSGAKTDTVGVSFVYHF